jgi:hypothetical protein
MISKSNSQTEIAGILQVDLSITSRDVSYIRQQAKQNFRKYIDERLPKEYEKCLVDLTSILRKSMKYCWSGLVTSILFGKVILKTIFSFITDSLFCIGIIGDLTVFAFQGYAINLSIYE